MTILLFITLISCCLFIADPLSLFTATYLNEIIPIIIFVGAYFAWQLYASINSEDGYEKLHVALTCVSTVGLVFIFLFIISWTGVFGDNTEVLRIAFLIPGAILCIFTPFGGNNPLELGVVKGLHALFGWARK